MTVGGLLEELSDGIWILVHIHSTLLRGIHAQTLVHAQVHGCEAKQCSEAFTPAHDICSPGVAMSMVSRDEYGWILQASTASTCICNFDALTAFSVSSCICLHTEQQQLHGHMLCTRLITQLYLNMSIAWKAARDKDRGCFLPRQCCCLVT